MFFSVEFLALVSFLYILFLFLIEFVIALVSQGFDFSFDSALVNICIGT